VNRTGAPVIPRADALDLKQQGGCDLASLMRAMGIASVGTS